MPYSISSLLWYLGILLISVWLAGKAERTLNKKERLTYIVLSYISIVLFCGFRFFVGNDYEGYFIGFKNCALLESNVMAWEPGYYLLNKLFFFSEIGYFYTLFLCTIITYAFVYLSIWREGHYKFSVFCVVALGFLITSNNLVRQGLAMSICLFSYRFIQNKKILQFYACVLLATLFHYSALVFGLAYFFDKFSFKKNTWTIILLFVLILQISGFASSMYQLIMSYVPYYGDIYTYKDRYHTDQRIGLSIIFNYLIALFYIQKADHDKNRILSNLYLIGTMTWGLFFGFSMFERIGFYFYYFLILAYPKFLKYSNMRSVIITIILVYFSLQSLFGLEKHGAVPYRTIYQENLYSPRYDKDIQQSF